MVKSSVVINKHTALCAYKLQLLFFFYDQRKLVPVRRKKKCIDKMLNVKYMYLSQRSTINGYWVRKVYTV